jgi:ATP-binding cassette subfamily B protein
MMICSSIVMLGMMFAALARAFASASRINEILDAPVDLEDGKEELSTLKEEGTIKFENVSFHYPESEKDILKNISFEIKQGETIAIVGSTGCGKSTLVNLLVRFYDVSEGKILVDNRDVRDFKQKDLRNIISICLQKAELFSGSIKENIAFGNEDASDDEINKVASISQAEDFINSKPQGIDSYVGEQGNELSGGQKQRVSIARALLKKPQIIIFDDSTSALDLVTEAKLHKALKKEMPNTTKIIIAQRIATAKNADKIIVLDDGNINGFDTHENLMKNNLIYQDIYSSQLKREAN